MKNLTLEAFSIEICDNNLLAGEKFYGNIGTLLGVIKNNYKYFALMEDEDKHLYLKNAALETSWQNDENMPVTIQTLFLGKKDYPLAIGAETVIRKSISKHHNLNHIYGGEVFTEFLKPTVFVGDDELIDHLRILKQNHPELPLIDTIHDYPFQEHKKL